MRKKIIAGNWKMNKDIIEVNDFAETLLKTNLEKYAARTDIIFFPPAIYISILQDFFKDSFVETGTQNISDFAKGAYTGEISASMLAAMNIKYSIIGHSERRKYFNETHEQLKDKLIRLHENNITAIFCCGEHLEDRNKGEHFNIIKKQIEDSVLSLPTDTYKNIIIAYEPIWAIGTGVTASPEQAQEMHAFIRKLFKENCNNEFAEQLRILYGGSVSPENCSELFSCDNIDGGLIGGASLKAESILAILENSIA